MYNYFKSKFSAEISGKIILKSVGSVPPYTPLGVKYLFGIQNEHQDAALMKYHSRA